MPGPGGAKAKRMLGWMGRVTQVSNCRENWLGRIRTRHANVTIGRLEVE
jgi:hypothetical protein